MLRSGLGYESGHNTYYIQGKSAFCLGEKQCMLVDDECISIIE